MKRDQLKANRRNGQKGIDTKNGTGLKKHPSRKYPSHGTNVVMGGKLKGQTSTDYLHFDCPKCGSSGQLDLEHLKVQIIDFKDSKGKIPVHHFGTYCLCCKHLDRVKIPCANLENPNYQFRRPAQLT